MPPPPTVACPRVLNGVGRVNPSTAVCVGHKDGFAYLLAAAHALPPDQAQTLQFFAPGQDDPDRELTGVEVLLRLPDPDLLLVRATVGGEPVPELPLVGRGKKPKLLPAPATAVGCPGGKPPAVRPDVVLARRVVRRPGGALGVFWETESAPVGGMSGGPLLDREGAVIGVCSAVSLTNGRGYFTHADEILAALAGGDHRWLVK